MSSKYTLRAKNCTKQEHFFFPHPRHHSQADLHRHGPPAGCAGARVLLRPGPLSMAVPIRDPHQAASASASSPPSTSTSLAGQQHACSPATTARAASAPFVLRDPSQANDLRAARRCADRSWSVRRPIASRRVEIRCAPSVKHRRKAQGCKAARRAGGWRPHVVCRWSRRRRRWWQWQWRTEGGLRGGRPPSHRHGPPTETCDRDIVQDSASPPTAGAASHSVIARVLPICQAGHLILTGEVTTKLPMTHDTRGGEAIYL